MSELITTSPAASPLDAQNFDHSLKLAERLAKSDLLPAHFKNKPENVLLVLALAQNLDVNPVMALQQISVIGGKPCLQATLMIALLNQKGVLLGPLRFRWEGERDKPDRRCIAVGTDKATGESIESEPVSLALAQAEGWTRNPKYRTMPDTMLKWRAAAFFIRSYYPEVVLGMHTAEELEDVNVATRTVPTGSAREKLAALRAAEAQREDPEEALEPVIVEVEPVSDDLPEEDGMFLDFLNSIEEAADELALTKCAEQGGTLAEESQRFRARSTVMARAKVLGLSWSKAEGCFVKKGGA